MVVADCCSTICVFCQRDASQFSLSSGFSVCNLCLLVLSTKEFFACRRLFEASAFEFLFDWLQTTRRLISYSKSQSSSYTIVLPGAGNVSCLHKCSFSDDDVSDRNSDDDHIMGQRVNLSL